MDTPLRSQTEESATHPACPLALDEAAREASWHSQRLDLSSTEFAVLAYLYRRAGQAVPNDALLQAVWGTPLDEGGSLWQVRSTVKRLRQKLAATAGHACQLVSIRGVGYRLDLPPGHRGVPPAHRRRSIALRISLVLMVVIALAAMAAAWLFMRRSGGNPTTLVWYRQQRVPVGVLWALQRGQHCIEGSDGALYCFDTPEERAAAIDVLLRDAAPQGQGQPREPGATPNPQPQSE